jgi:protein involved in polysaccharide export with SLBB domain
MGCAAWTNPAIHTSVPVRRLPDEVLGKPREEQLDIPQALLRQEQPKEHIIGPGDILGIVFDSILGSRDQVPTVQVPPVGASYRNIGVGFPIAVLGDGTISLPIVDPIPVSGKTIPEAKETIARTYIERGILKPDAVKLLVTLIRPREFRVLVVRQDSGGILYGGTQLSQPFGFNLANKRGSGIVLDLPIYENDLLTALTKSGGLPGNDAKNEVLIERGALKGNLKDMTTGPIPGLETIRIPLRLRPGEPIPFKPEDVILDNGDIVFIQSRDSEVFYVGGLIQPGEYPLPRDSDLDVLEAVLATRGPVVNGALNNNNFTGVVVGQGLGSVSPSQLSVLRRAPGNRQIIIHVDLNRAIRDPRERILVQPGDVLILQETMAEAFTRYATVVIRSNFFAQYLSTPSASGTVQITSP